MDVTAVLTTLRHGNQLKRTARTGWVQRGVPQPEDVAAHSYGVSFAVLVLAQIIDEPLDLGKALAIAVLHDLPEGLTTDIPGPAWRFLPPGIKSDVERRAMAEILDGIPFASGLVSLWEELHLNESREARLVHDADALDLFVQALIYEEQSHNSHLSEFWQVRRRFHFPEAQALYEALCEQRSALASRNGSG